MVTDPNVKDVPDTAEAIRLAKEELVVEKRDVSSTVHISTRTVSEDVTVDEMLQQTSAEVVRVPIDRHVDEAPQIEQRGDTMVIPVFEEVLVKRILLREELHVKVVATQTPHRETVSLRRQEPIVERSDGE